MSHLSRNYERLTRRGITTAKRSYLSSWRLPDGKFYLFLFCFFFLSFFFNFVFFLVFKIYTVTSATDVYIHTGRNYARDKRYGALRRHYFFLPFQKGRITRCTSLVRNATKSKRKNGSFCRVVARPNCGRCHDKYRCSTPRQYRTSPRRGSSTIRLPILPMLIVPISIAAT